MKGFIKILRTQDSKLFTQHPAQLSMLREHK